MNRNHTIQRLFGQLHSLDNMESFKSAVELSRIKDPSMVEPVLKYLREVRERNPRRLPATAEPLIRCLGKIGNCRVLDDLILFIRDENPSIREAVVYALGKINDRNSIPDLVKALADTDKRVRASAARALSALRDPSSLNALVIALDDESPYVAYAAARALGSLKDSRAFEPLLKALEDPAAREVWKYGKDFLNHSVRLKAYAKTLKSLEYVDVREAAAYSLGIMRDPRAVQPLSSLLSDDNDRLRGLVALSLGRIKDLRAKAPLIAVARDKSSFVRKCVDRALRMLAQQSEDLR